MTTSMRTNHSHDKAIFKKKQRAKVQFNNLPEDMLHLILSQIPLKEAVRTSLLSSEWRHMWTSYPKLKFDGTTMCDSDSCSDVQQYTQKFIENVNAVLRQHSGMAVDEFEVKYPFHNMLVDHLNDWVNFAASSRAKNLVLDLEPAKFRYCDYRYLFPFELFDNEGVSRLERIQLSMVSFKIPAQFSGFPNLRVLDLRIIQVSANDLQHLLSNCFNLERLSVALCNLHDELTVFRPLSRLQYLSVSWCFINKISFHAKNLKTFMYEGETLSIDLSETLQLTDADIIFGDLTLEHALTVLPRDLPCVENLNLAAYMSDKMLQLSQGPSKFSHLKHLKLKLIFSEHMDSLRYLAYFLRAAPVLETLDMHLLTVAIPCFGELSIRSLPHCVHDRLKRVCIKGFIAARGEIELAADIIESSPNLEVLFIDPIRPSKFDDPKEAFYPHARSIAKRYLAGKIAPGVRFEVL